MPKTDAARKFPSHVDCKTAHSIAYRATAYQIKDRVRTLSIFDITRYVDIKRIYGYEENDIAFLVLKLLRVFVNSDKKEIDKKFKYSGVLDDVYHFPQYALENIILGTYGITVESKVKSEEVEEEIVSMQKHTIINSEQDLPY